jgi:hypothetical protein
MAVGAAGSDDVLVVVNGEPLTAAVLNSYRSDLPSPSGDPSSSNRLVEDIATGSPLLADDLLRSEPSRDDRERC